MSQDSPVALANRRIPFAAACRWLDISIPGDVPEHGMKVHCPFEQFVHEDGGAEPAFRVYPDHGWCFACGEYFTPVKLCAAVWDLTQDEAARQMLRLAGIADPDYKQQWQRLVDWSQPPDVDGLAAALRTYCGSACPRWKTRQYDKPVSDKLAKCIGLLALVRTEKDCRDWLAGCKKAMAQVLCCEDQGEGARQ